MDVVIKSLRSLFTLIHSLPSKWQLNLRKAEEHVVALSNLAEQLGHVLMVSEDNNDLELMQFRNFKPLLVAKIYGSAEEDLEAVQKIVDECGQMIMDIKGKLNNLEQTAESIDWSQEREVTLLGSPTMPAVIQLMEWAEDLWKYYHVQHLQMTCALIALQLEEYETIIRLQEAVRPKLDPPPTLQWRLALTRPLIAEAPPYSASAAAAAAFAAADAASHTPPAQRSARTALYSRNV